MQSGSYVYLLNDAPVSITETWSIETLATEQRKIVSKRRAPQYGSHIRVEATESGGQITGFSVSWANSAEGAVREAHAHYTISPQTVEVSRMVEGRASEDVYAVTAPLIVSPLLRIFTGRVIRQVAAVGRGQPVNVLVPWILDPADGGRLLTPKIEPRSARRVGAEAVALGAVQHPAEKYAYLGEQYDDTAEFWLDADDRLLRYRFTQNHTQRWDVYLSE